MLNRTRWILGTSSSALLFVMAGGLVALAQGGDKDESERKVKESDVPAPALAALKKLAGGAALTEFSEEIEHGQKYYEGSFKGKDGNTDVLVTASGDLVEIEEAVAADQVPASVMAAARKEAGKEAAIHFEKKTVIMYEAAFTKDKHRHELTLMPDGRMGEHEEKKTEKDED